MVPFDGDKLTRLLEDAGVDVLLASTRHNVRYLTGGYYYHFAALAPRGGASQYLSFVGIPRGRYDAAFYVGRGGEERAIDVRSVWIDRRSFDGGGTTAAAETAARTIAASVGATATVAVELPFLPADAFVTLQRALPHARFVDATMLLHELRAIKTPAEIDVLRQVSEKVAASIQETFQAGRDGLTTAELSAVCQRAMADRGLNFLWSFTSAGPSYRRAPSDEPWRRGQVLHLDCGGDIGDYLADICRMGSLGVPSALAAELNQACLDVQEFTRALLKPGVRCGDVNPAGEERLRATGVPGEAKFVAHGMGMVSHEQPVMARGNARPLATGMVVSIETEVRHPEVGHVKIEDTVAITENGCVGLGDLGRDLTIVQ